AQMVDSSSKALLDEISSKQRAIRFWPIVLVLAIGAVGATAWAQWPQWASIAVGAIGVLAVAAGALRDTLRKTAVVIYDLDAGTQQAYEVLHDVAEKMAKSSGLWHIEAEGAVRDRKYHAGANTLMRRKATFINWKAPNYLKTNVATFALGVGRQ